MSIPYINLTKKFNTFGTLTALMDTKSGRDFMTKKTNMTSATFARALFYTTAVTLAATVHPTLSYANPQGGSVIAGQANIVQTTSTRVDINQSSNKAIINWDSFSIGANEHTNFNQPSASSVTLNRVVGEDPSAILGRLTANGHLMLVNPNGVFFGKGAKVDVGSITATTSDIDNNNFMAGRYIFNKPGKPGAGIVNEGHISIAENGLAAFVSPFVRNDGVITGRLSRIVLGGGDKFVLDLYGDKLISFEVDPDVAQQIEVTNNGTIDADGSLVLITAAEAKGLVDSVINLNGLVQANQVAEVNGRIIVGGGDVNVGGTLLANNGKIIVDTDGHANLLKSGKVVANKGFIELSGEDLTVTGEVEAIDGHLYLDPNTITIDTVAGTNVITVAQVLTWLDTLSVVDIAAKKTINVNAEIDSSTDTNTATLNLRDEDANNKLTVNLRAKIILGANQTLTGEATTVNIKDTDVDFNNAVDVAVAGAKVNIDQGTYTIDEQISVDKQLNIVGK